jgi:hypothetical protein
MTATTELSRDAMWQELSASFPAMFKRPAEDFSAQYAGAGGIQVGGEVEFDGLPIFPTIFYDCDEYDGYVLTAFTAWAESRGWGVEMYDVGVFLMFPLSRWMDV